MPISPGPGHLLLFLTCVTPVAAANQPGKLFNLAEPPAKIDDDPAPEVDWWLDQSKAHGNFPLTWLIITGRVNGLDHDGARFALVKAVPDRGEVVLSGMGLRAD